MATEFVCNIHDFLKSACDAVKIGATFRRRLEYEDELGVPIDISNEVFKMNIEDKDGNLVIPQLVLVGDALSTGLFKDPASPDDNWLWIQINKATTITAAPGIYKYDLAAENVATEEDIDLEGVIEFSESVTLS